MRLLFLLAVFFIAFLVVRKLMSFKRSDQNKVLDDDTNAPETMVKCHVCGVNQPISESIVSQGNYYCSDAHWEQHKESTKKTATESTKNSD